MGSAGIAPSARQNWIKWSTAKRRNGMDFSFVHKPNAHCTTTKSALPSEFMLFWCNLMQLTSIYIDRAKTRNYATSIMRAQEWDAQTGRGRTGATQKEVILIYFDCSLSILLLHGCFNGVVVLRHLGIQWKLIEQTSISEQSSSSIIWAWVWVCWRLGVKGWMEEFRKDTWLQRIYGTFSTL